MAIREGKKKDKIFLNGDLNEGESDPRVASKFYTQDRRRIDQYLNTLFNKL